MKKIINEIISWIPAIIMIIIFIGSIVFMFYMSFRHIRDCTFGNYTIANAPIYCHSK